MFLSRTVFKRMGTRGPKEQHKVQKPILATEYTRLTEDWSDKTPYHSKDKMSGTRDAKEQHKVQKQRIQAWSKTGPDPATQELANHTVPNYFPNTHPPSIWLIQRVDAKDCMTSSWPAICEKMQQGKDKLSGSHSVPLRAEWGSQSCWSPTKEGNS